MAVIFLGKEAGGEPVSTCRWGLAELGSQNAYLIRFTHAPTSHFLVHHSYLVNALALT